MMYLSHNLQCQAFNGAMTFRIKAFSIMMLSTVTLSIMTFNVRTLSIMTFSITTLVIMTFSITVNKIRH